MPTFNSEEEIKKYLLNQSKIAIENAANKIYKIIDKHLLKYYGEYNPEMYLRTNQLLNSLVKKDAKIVGNTVRASVYFNVGALKYDEEVRAYLRGDYDGKNKKHTQGRELTLSAKPDKAKTIYEAMHGGTHGGHGSGTAIWDESMIELKSIVDVIVDELRKAGIPIK